MYVVKIADWMSVRLILKELELYDPTALVVGSSNSSLGPTLTSLATTQSSIYVYIGSSNSSLGPTLTSLSTTQSSIYVYIHW